MQPAVLSCSCQYQLTLEGCYQRILLSNHLSIVESYCVALATTYAALLLLPQELRTNLLQVQCSIASLAASTLQQQQQQQQSEAVVQIMAGCRLPAGLHLSSSSSSNDANVLLGRPVSCQQLLVDQGPAAVVAAAAAAAREQAACNTQTATPAAAAAAAAGDVSPASLLTKLGGMQQVYEMVVCPADDDPLRSLKLQLLAATGLGLSHCFTMPDCETEITDPATAKEHQDQKQQQQQQQQGWQQQHLTSVLSAMAVSLCDDEHLLQPAVVQQIVQQRQQAVAAAAGGMAAAAVSSTAGMLIEESGGSVAAAAAAATGKRSDAAGAATAQAAGAPADAAAAAGQGAWQNLQGRLLKRYNKACRKQLRQAFTADAHAVQEALQGLQTLNHTTSLPAAAAAAAAAAGSERATEGTGSAVQKDASSSSSRCSCLSPVGTGSSRTRVAIDHPGVAAAGVREYLDGLARLLSAWMLQLQALSTSSGGKAVGAKQGSSGGRADKGSKTAKKQRQQ
jgi:hypothetical protein